jgi:hypothetical protein
VIAGPDHGHDDDAAVAELLRAAPPPEALAWVGDVLGGGTVVDVVSMRGGASASMHRVSVRDAQGRVREVVLRRYLRPEQQAEQPSCALIEANALTHVASASFLTPELLGVDAAGATAGAPAVLMSRLDGQPRWEGKRRHWPGELVELAMAIHDLPVPDPGVVRDFALYAQRSYAPPRWASDPTVWERAAEIFHGPVPGPRRLIHRDFYPGNVLWRRSHLAGVVDWESASVGPPAFDVAHCRLNFFYATPDLAEHLLLAWEQATGQSYDPWADIAAIMCVLDSLRDRPPGSSARHALDSALARAVSDHAT